MNFYSIIISILRRFPPGKWVPLGQTVEGGQKNPTYPPASNGAVTPKVSCFLMGKLFIPNKQLLVPLLPLISSSLSGISCALPCVFPSPLYPNHVSSQKIYTRYYLIIISKNITHTRGYHFSTADGQISYGYVDS